MRLLRVLGKLLATLVALVVLAYLAINVSGSVAAHHKRDRLASMITKEIQARLPASQRRARALADRVTIPPAQSWSAQQCGFETTDAGWMVQDYRQVCVLESGRAWPMETRAGLAQLKRLSSVKPFESDHCTTTAPREQASAGRTEVLYLEAGGTRAQRYCAPMLNAFEGRRVLSGTLPDLAPDRGWLVVLDTSPLVDEPLGCAHWSVLFCDNPFGDKLAWGRTRE